MLAKVDDLTAREKQLLWRIALGRSDHEIASQIGGTEAQVSAQRIRLLRKLNIHSRAEITYAAEKLARWKRVKKGLSYFPAASVVAPAAKAFARKARDS